LYKLNAKFRLLGASCTGQRPSSSPALKKIGPHDPRRVHADDSDLKGENVRNRAFSPNGLKSRLGYYQKECHLN
jgi:hypothetical protein